MTVEIKVKGHPPLHQCGVSIFSPKHPHKDRVEEFIKLAGEAMKNKAFLEGRLIMEVEYSGLFPLTDPVNVVFAFPNMFEGIVYQDDNQIRAIRCWEREGNEPQCLVRFRNL